MKSLRGISPSAITFFTTFCNPSPDSANASPVPAPEMNDDKIRPIRAPFSPVGSGKARKTVLFVLYEE